VGHELRHNVKWRLSCTHTCKIQSNMINITKISIETISNLKNTK